MGWGGRLDGPGQQGVMGQRWWVAWEEGGAGVNIVMISPEFRSSRPMRRERERESSCCPVTTGKYSCGDTTSAGSSHRPIRVLTERREEESFLCQTLFYLKCSCFSRFFPLVVLSEKLLVVRTIL